MDKKYHHFWFTAERAAPMVGLSVPALLAQTHKDQESLWTMYKMTARRNTDHGDAFDSNEVWYYSPRSSLVGNRTKLGDLPFSSVGGAFLMICQRWSKILEARDVERAARRRFRLKGRGR